MDPNKTYVGVPSENPAVQKINQMIANQEFENSYEIDLPDYETTGKLTHVDLLEGIFRERQRGKLTEEEAFELGNICTAEMANNGYDKNKFLSTLDWCLGLTMISQEEYDALVNFFDQFHKPKTAPKAVAVPRKGVRKKLGIALAGTAAAVGLGALFAPNFSQNGSAVDSTKPAITAPPLLTVTAINGAPKTTKSPNLAPVSTLKRPEALDTVQQNRRPLETTAPIAPQIAETPATVNPPAPVVQAPSAPIETPKIVIGKAEIALLSNPDDSTKGIFNAPMTKMRLRSQGWTIIETRTSEEGNTILVVENNGKKGTINISKAQNSNIKEVQIEQL